MPGPLDGLRVVEPAGPGSGPFCGMMLADCGAGVNSRRPHRIQPRKDLLSRSRGSIAVNVKNPDGIRKERELAAGAFIA